LTHANQASDNGVMKQVFVLTVALLFGLNFNLAFAKKSFFDLEARSLSGQSVALRDYSGQVILVVNVASKCGYTPQYEGLQKIFNRYKAKKFTVLGFPSNDFGQQEPGTSGEIAKFCKLNYGVTFPLFEKNPVSGSKKQPVYEFLLSSLSEKKDKGGEVSWNFEKFLIDRKGQVVDRFKSNVAPEDPGLTKRIEELL